MPRGARPWPFGVGKVTCEFAVDDAPATVGFWFFDPSGFPSDYTTAHAIADQFVLSPLAHLMNVNSRAAYCAACRVRIMAGEPADARVQFDAVQGLWPGAQAMNATCGWRLVSSSAGRGRASVTRIPSCPDQFIDSTWRLSASGYANLRDQGSHFINAFNAMVGGGGANLQLGTLHQFRAGLPLNPPTFDPALTVLPSPHVLTIRRRLPSGVQVSPF